MFYATMIITKSQTKNEIVTFQHYITCKHQGLLSMMKLEALGNSKIKIKVSNENQNGMHYCNENDLFKKIVI